ncbi:hypothetical protein GCM10010371_65660 [Streptomyces subrutilus]|uniref:Uncharacterized protein n=1 Tax=Streptomyces subrutilus TaxID=36818 RepID=A0A918RH07_9ACTN|nr:hypothetical protein GCM10010371_65660 [Streptomyces subrutilus]
MGVVAGCGACGGGGLWGWVEGGGVGGVVFLGEGLFEGWGVGVGGVYGVVWVRVVVKMGLLFWWAVMWVWWGVGVVAVM